MEAISGGVPATLNEEVLKRISAATYVATFVDCDIHRDVAAI